MDYGYARVSTKEQNEQRQIIALTQFGLSENAFMWTSNPEEISSGRSTSGWCAN